MRARRCAAPHRLCLRGVSCEWQPGPLRRARAASRARAAADPLTRPRARPPLHPRPLAQHERTRRLQQEAKRQREADAAARRSLKRQRDDELLLALKAEDEDGARLQAAEADALAELRAEWARADAEEATRSVLSAASAQGLHLTRMQLQERAQMALDANAALFRRAAFELSGRGEVHALSRNSVQPPTDEPYAAADADTEAKADDAQPRPASCLPGEREPGADVAVGTEDSEVRHNYEF